MLTYDLRDFAGCLIFSLPPHKAKHCEKNWSWCLCFLQVAGDVCDSSEQNQPLGLSVPFSLVQCLTPWELV